jgi:hypothetical protein
MMVTFEDIPEAQLHKKAAGAPMMMRLMRQIFALDCAPAFYALQRGSSSVRLQLAAEAVCLEGLEAKVASLKGPLLARARARSAAHCRRGRRGIVGGRPPVARPDLHSRDQGADFGAVLSALLEGHA